MCLLLMKQKLYALDAFFIEKLKLSENDPSPDIANVKAIHEWVKLLSFSVTGLVT